jgi:signal transduction histidine kinase/ligand-binding sensor domain-containing protein
MRAASIGALLIGLPIACLLGIPTFAATAAPDELRQFRHTVFGPEKGAPSDAIAMAQTTDGFLWIATTAALLRYDGERFDSELGNRLPNAGVSALLAEPDGSLWIGYLFGGASVVKDGNIRGFDQGQLPRGSVKQFFRSADGVLWAATTSGLGRLVGDRWEAVDERVGYSGEEPEWMGTSASGFLVVTGTASFLYTPESGTLVRHPRIEGQLLRYRIPKDSAWRPAFVDERQRGIFPTRSIFDRTGTLWMAGPDDTALVRYRWSGLPSAVPEEDRFADTKGYVDSIFEDREGNVWVSTDRSLDRFSIPKARHILADTDGKSLLMSGDRGEVWLSRTDQPVTRLSPEGGEIPALGESVRAAFRGTDGTVWVAGKEGILEYADGAVRRRLPMPVGKIQSPELKVSYPLFQAIAVDDQGAVWLSVARVGLFRWNGEAWTEAEDRYPVLPHGPAVRLLVDARTRLWIGYPNDQLVIMQGDKPAVFTQVEGLHVGNVLALDVKDTHAWIAGDHGVAAMIGARFVPLHGAGTTDFRGSSGIVETVQGELWLNATEGVYRISAADVAGALGSKPQPAAFQLLNWFDGVEGGVEHIRPGPTMLGTPDGRLWIVRRLGIWSIDTAHIPTNPVAPIVSVEDVVCNGVRYPPGSDLIFEPGSRNFQIDYTAASLTQPERVRFRYRLLKADETWQEAGQRRQAYYTFLSPGHYEFQVIAANEDGVWSNTNEALGFTIKPALYQRLGFKIAVGVFAFVVLIVLFFFRLEQLQRRYRRGVEARQAEREQIARDLHDTLLQGVQAMLFRVQIWGDDSDIPQARRSEMAAVAHQTKAMVVEGRERILMMRRTDALSADFAESLASLGGDASIGTAPAFELNIKGQPRTLTMAVEEQLLDVAREAVRNACQHSGSSRVVLDLEYRRRSLMMTITDDGRGFDPEKPPQGAATKHFGLVGMRERARQVGAELRIHSTSHSGTRVEMVVPAAAAYRDTFRWPWQRRAAECAK